MIPSPFLLSDLLKYIFVNLFVIINKVDVVFDGPLVVQRTKKSMNKRRFGIPAGRISKLHAVIRQPYVLLVYEIMPARFI